MARVPPISASEREEILRWVHRTEAPEIRERQKEIARVLLDLEPGLRKEVRDEGLREGLLDGLLAGERVGRFEEARAALRRVFARRGLALSADEDARIQACTDLATLERWHDEAIVASCAADALR